MNIPLTDLQAQYHLIKNDIDNAISGVCTSGHFVMGPEVKVFETQMQEYLGVKHAIGVGSGTDALRLALLACDIKPGDEVITSAFTFVATVEVIVECGATPIFVDIDQRTFNINPKLVKNNVTPKTKAIMPVHLFGQPADMSPIIDIANETNIKIIEDSAQALGSEYKERKVGTIGNAGCLSFFPSKNLGAFGDGGMVVTDDDVIASTVDVLRKHGAYKSYHYRLAGYNSRLDTLQAAILSVKLNHLDNWNEQRRRHAAQYVDLLRDLPGIVLPFVPQSSKSSYNYFTIRIPSGKTDRDNLKQHLIVNRISTAVYYPLCLHLQEAYSNLGYTCGMLPESESAQDQVLSLPMYPELTEEMISRVCNCIRGFFLQ
jgi:dTDP-4-amino-4,6-dideoxygalactose transaminase